ncbi:unnamed protein product [Euphydryas editha]|uniref:Uncharacterized protein n=1 Tax=Euphydryas editha TaxID=104508 RepID=A0AAU9TA25_EUPED|nr:unnamed protein product [Euphydryas editha]
MVAASNFVERNSLDEICTSLPIQVLSVSLKLEGLIDLGPKWNYVYKLSPSNRDHDINLDDPNEKSTNKDEESRNILKYDHLFKPDVSNREISKNNKDDSRNHVKLALQRDDDIKKDKKRNKASKASKNTSKIDKSSKKYYKFTKQFVPLRSTHKFDDDISSESNKNRNEIENKNIDTDDKKNKNSNLLIFNSLNGTKLKDNIKINNFILHIFKQSLKVFDKMKTLADDEKIKRKIKSLRNAYVVKFGEFINETGEHKLKTKLASQNVVLNTIDMSNNILKRLANHLALDTKDGDGNIKRNFDISKLFEREIKIEKYIENKHACTKLNICRTDNEHSDFIVNVLIIILQTNDYKIKQAANSITETVKNSDLTNILDNETEKELRKIMTNIETWEPSLIRSMFYILKNVIQNKNRPITVMNKVDASLANRTVSFYNLIDVLNKNMGTVENKLRWKEFIKGLEDWRDGKRNDVQSIIEGIIKQMIDCLEKLDYEIRKSVTDIFKVIINPKLR